MYCGIKSIKLTSKLFFSYHRSSREEKENYTSVPIVVLTVHRAQEEAKEQRSHASYEAEDALPVSGVYERKIYVWVHLHFFILKHYIRISNQGL